MKKTILILAVLSLASFLARSSETDNYLAWDQTLKDSSTEINRYYNDLIVQELKKINRRPFIRKSCVRVATWIGKKMISGNQKHTDHWIKGNKNIDKYPKYGGHRWDYLKSSIYKNVWKLGTNIGPTININSIYTGSDKISHFLGIGYLYYLRYNLHLKLNRNRNLSSAVKKLNALKKAIEFGLYTEKFILGESHMSSGVFSYGDMESNYQGLLFFKSFCEGETPRLQKKRGRWQWMRNLDIRNYVNPKWDETYYSNHYTKARWNHVKPFLLKYCSQRTHPIVMAKMDHYNQIDKPSFSSRFLEARVKNGQAPGLAEHSLNKLCQSEGLN
jgi:hypothetical protein